MKWIQTSPRWLIWGLIFPLLVINGWFVLVVLDYFQTLITIFVSATIFSFILDYPVRWLQQQSMMRVYAVVFVFLLGMLGLLISGVTLFPIVLTQLNDLVVHLPTWLESGSEQVQTLQRWAAARRLPIDLTELNVQLQNNLPSQIQALTSGVWSFGLGVVGITFNVTLTIVLTFYMLLHGDRLWDGLFSWLPSPLNVQIRQSLRRNFQNYFLGQAALACLMGISMTVAFLVIKLPFGLLFGLVIGVMTLFPFGAVLSIWIVSFLMALTSFWLGVRVLTIGLLIDQSIESGIAPRLLGRFTGLNPVWVLVVLILGAKIAGVLGLLVAVPTASFIKTTVDMLRASPNPFVTPSPSNH
jgi:predicted PurR-regulated permease PerM